MTAKSEDDGRSGALKEFNLFLQWFCQKCPEWLPSMDTRNSRGFPSDFNILAFIWNFSDFPRMPRGWSENYLGVNSKGKIVWHFLDGAAGALGDSLYLKERKKKTPEFVLDNLVKFYKKLTWEQLETFFRMIREEEKPDVWRSDDLGCYIKIDIIRSLRNWKIIPEEEAEKPLSALDALLRLT